jgi:hypothetical protein
MMLAVAVVAILLGTGGSGVLRDRRERCFEIADNHARIAANYRATAQVYPAMLRAAEWHDLQRDIFLRAAARPWFSIPRSVEMPPASSRPEAVGDFTTAESGRAPNLSTTSGPQDTGRATTAR